MSQAAASNPSSYQSTAHFRGAYRISPDLLRRLANIINEHIQNRARLIFTFDNGDRAESDDAEALCDDPLTRAHRITEIRFSGHSYGLQPSRSVSLSLEPNATFGMTIMMVLSGDSAGVILTRQRVETELRGEKLWYSPLTLHFGPKRIGMISSFLGVLIGLSIGAAYMSGVPWFVILLAGGVAFYGLFMAKWLWRLLFPLVVFEIGRGKDRAATLAAVRNLIFVGVILATVVGLATSFLFARLFP